VQLPLLSPDEHIMGDIVVQHIFNDLEGGAQISIIEGRLNTNLKRGGC
jgi:hypothetical protein